ncbi:MAG: ABC transporter permease [Candidatus Polarisedimenticolia bacterium]
MRTLLAAAALLLLGALAPTIAPYDPDEIVDVMGARDLAPGSRVSIFTRDDGTRFAASAFEQTHETLLYVRGGRREEIPLSRVLPDRTTTRRFVLGSDGFGRDLLSRILHGARLSTGIGGLAVLVGLGIGLAAGGAGGYLGGMADAGLMRLVDAMHAVPRLFLFLLCAALFGPSALLVGLVLGATGWPGIARITRAQVLSLRESGFAAAARAMGASRSRILLRHILPHCAGPVGVAAVLLAADTILAESSLSFIGLGVQPPAASWGSLIAAAREGVATAWWVAVFPGLCIVITVLILHAMVRPNGLNTHHLP